MKHKGKHINLPLKAITTIFKCLREGNEAKVRVDAGQREAILLLADKLEIIYGGRCTESSTTKLYFNSRGSSGISYIGFDGDGKGAEDHFLKCSHVEINLTEEYNLPQSVIKKIIYSIVNKSPFKVRGSKEELQEVVAIVQDMGGSWSAGEVDLTDNLQIYCKFPYGENTILTCSTDESWWKATTHATTIQLKTETVIPLSKKGMKRWMKQGRSFRLKVSCVEESIWIQETLFKLGMDWAHSRINTVHTGRDFLFFHGKDCAGVKNCLSYYTNIVGDGDERKDFPIVKLDCNAVAKKQKSKEDTMVKGKVEKWLETDQEIYGALLGGKTLVLARTGGVIYKLVNRRICRKSTSLNSVWEPVEKPMSQVQPLKEYKEPQWYDNLTNGTQVLCWVGGYVEELEHKLYLGLVNEFKSGAPSAFQTVSGAMWRYATPVTKEEILPNILK